MLSNLRREVVEDFEFLSPLGRGGFCEVFRVLKKPSQKTFALKRYPSLFRSIGDTRNIIRELVVFRALGGSGLTPRVETVLCTEMRDSFPFYGGVALVMEEFPCDLRRFMKGPEGRDCDVRALAFQLAQAVDFLHRSGLIHRDLKPDNVLIDPSTSRLVITDFNHARLFDAETPDDFSERSSVLSTTGGESFFGESRGEGEGALPPQTKVLGTRFYRPPEVLLLQDHDDKADIWAFGCIVLELLHCKLGIGSHPFFLGENCETLSPRSEPLTAKSEPRPSTISLSKKDQILAILRALGPQPRSAFSFVQKEKFRRFLENFSKFRCRGPGLMARLEGLNIDPRLVDLLARALSLDPSRRPSAAQILGHPFFAALPLSPPLPRPLRLEPRLVELRQRNVSEARLAEILAEELDRYKPLCPDKRFRKKSNLF